MSVAIMVHKEANGVDGGNLYPPLGGFINNDQFYPRKLNTLLVNQSNTLVAFDGVGYTFTVSPGTYRISIWMLYNSTGSVVNVGYHAGLFNVSTAKFEVFTGGTEAILSSTGMGNDGSTTTSKNNRIMRLEGQFVVAGSNKVYQIMHKTSSPTWGGLTTAQGINDQMNGANVNSAAASQFYMVVKVGLES